MSPTFPSTQTLQETWQTPSGTTAFNPQALEMETAKTFMRSYTQAFREGLGQEQIPLEQALGRVLAQPIIANINVPAADNSAMDGYAFHSSVLKNFPEITLQVVGKHMAGQALDLNVIKNFAQQTDCLRIMTGALIPPCCDTVIPQEGVIVSSATIQFSAAKIAAGENLRQQGEDLRSGDRVLDAGRILRPSDLGLIASMGMPAVSVKKRLIVAYFSTGNEVTALGENLSEGALYDSNRYTLLGMLTKLGCQLLDLGIVRDDPEALREAFSVAAEQADAIITSGGVSVGEADFTKKIMQDLGDVAFWTLAIKPGRPMAFGKIHVGNAEAVLFGLPGNPVAVMVTFYQFVQDILFHMSGADYVAPLYQARFHGALSKKPGRTEFVRGVLFYNATGELWVRPHGYQGSGVLRSMSEADCLILVNAQQSECVHGEFVNISPIHQTI